MSTVDERLESIRGELGVLLEERVSALMGILRETESLTRQIVSTELESARVGRLRDELAGETTRAESDLEALRQDLEAVRERHTAAVGARDNQRATLERLEQETVESQRELEKNRGRARELQSDRDALQQETTELNLKVRGLEETVDEFRKRREEMRSIMSRLSRELGGSGAGE